MRKLKWITLICFCLSAAYFVSCSNTPAATENKTTPDTTAPVVTVLSPTNNQEIGSNTTFFGTVTDDSSGVAKLYIQIELNPTTEVAVSNGYWSTNISYSTLGTKTIQFTASDVAGNNSSPLVLSVNRQAIPFVVITNTTFGQITSNAQFEVKGKCGIDSPAIINNIFLFFVTNDVTNVLTAAVSEPDWKIKPDLQTGSNWMIASAEGDNGKSNYSAPMLIVRDSLAPIPGNNGTVNISGLHETSMGVSWARASDDYTSQANIQYRLLLVNTADNSTNTPFSWTADVTSFNCTGLTVNTSYKVYVQAMDSAGNLSNYYVWTQTTPDETAPLPTNNGAITIDNITTNGFQMIWQRATDNVTAKGSIQYLIVRSYSSNLNTPSSAEANGTIVAGWTTYADDTVTNTLTGLLDSTTYYVNVIAKDAAGNSQVYVCHRTATLSADGPLPIPGNSGTFSGVKNGSNVDLSWTKATDVNTHQTNLQYRVYYSAAGNIDTVSNIVANGTDISGGWKTDISTLSYGPLADHSMTYYNILVRDSSGNISNYIMYMHYQF